MKVAICVSGELRGNEDLCNELRKRYLPYDEFFHDWSITPLPQLPDTESFIRAFDTYIKSLSEQDPSRIHFTKKFNSGLKHHARIYQHYNHWHCLQLVPDEYDMIVRIRPDAVLQEHDWAGDIQRAYDTDTLYGYGSGQGVAEGLVSRFASDFVILHRRERMRNPYKIDLCPGHVGWWICLYKQLDEVFINNNDSVKLVREL
jgi:hypothetical protein